MSIAQNTDLGVINRLRASITLPSFPALNVTANMLSETGIRISPDRGGGELLGQMSGAVVSLNPYTTCRVSFEVLRTLSVGTNWYSQWLSNSAVLDLHITPVTSVAPSHYIRNAVISHVGDIDENGTTATMPIVLTGTLILNTALWSGV